ncbi:hypothetical protein ACQ4PT_017089 [Festuca glaucescens]
MTGATTIASVDDGSGLAGTELGECISSTNREKSHLHLSRLIHLTGNQHHHHLLLRLISSSFRHHHHTVPLAPNPSHMAAALASSRCCGRPPLLPTGRGRRSVARCALSGEKGNSFSWKECAISVALSVGLITAPSTFGWSAHASPLEPVIPNISVLISGPPIKDPGALLRYALPIDNKAIREVQKPLEDITDSLKVAGVRALDSVERNVRQASRALSNGRSLILTGLAEPKRANGEEILDKLAVGLEELQRIVEDRNRKAVAPKQKELLNYVGT